MEDKHPPEKGEHPPEKDEPTPEKGEPATEERVVKPTTEVRQGKVFKGAPMWWVLVISTVTAALALLIIYLLFVRAA